MVQHFDLFQADDSFMSSSLVTVTDQEEVSLVLALAAHSLADNYLPLRDEPWDPYQRVLREYQALTQPVYRPSRIKTLVKQERPARSHKSSLTSPKRFMLPFAIFDVAR
ncbi:hypothetical protein BaRGS_00002105 [Batillaria attramentaria]|uniref:Uncharacterized protein n=1 Tax=Batillaria attramentaria TaxID=370345 RepID=A0ABD0M3Z1_9CAEN